MPLYAQQTLLLTALYGLYHSIRTACYHTEVGTRLPDGLVMEGVDGKVCRLHYII